MPRQTAKRPPRAIDARIELEVGDGARAFSLRVELTLEASVLVLFGPSGAGKSLTLQALAGLLPHVRGHLCVAHETLLDTAHGVDLPADARRVGYVPQHHALFPFLDVAGNVGFGLPRAQRGGPKVAAILEELGLASLATARPEALSGGERQRVALARALVIAPRLLLLDEPFASIDEPSRAALGGLVREVLERRGIPAVLVTHARDEALALGDWVVRLEGGRTREAGAARAVLAGDEVRITGVQRGAAQALGEGRVRVTLEGAAIEGPGARVSSEDGALIDLRLA